MSLLLTNHIGKLGDDAERLNNTELRTLAALIKYRLCDMHPDDLKMLKHELIFFNSNTLEWKDE